MSFGMSKSSSGVSGLTDQISMYSKIFLGSRRSGISEPIASALRLAVARTYSPYLPQWRRKRPNPQIHLHRQKFEEYDEWRHALQFSLERGVGRVEEQFWSS